MVHRSTKEHGNTSEMFENPYRVSSATSDPTRTSETAHELGLDTVSVNSINDNSNNVNNDSKNSTNNYKDHVVEARGEEKERGYSKSVVEKTDLPDNPE